MRLDQIRLHGERFDPAAFKGRGWRGWWVRVLNAIRWRLETHVNWHVWHLLSTTAQMDLLQTKQQMQFDEIPPTRKFREAPYILQTPSIDSPAPVRSTAEETTQMLARLSAGPRSKRYANGRRHFLMYDVETEDAENTKGNGQRTDEDRSHG